jgi:hypothetical protein
LVAGSNPAGRSMTKARIIKRDGEYQVRITVNGKPQPERTYFTNDRADVIATRELMLEEAMNDRETIPCVTCGMPTPFTGTKRCNNCWEVESRLNQYLRSPKGETFVAKAMAGILIRLSDKDIKTLSKWASVQRTLGQLEAWC